MEHSILEKMQAIEDQANLVLANYDKQIKQIKVNLDNDLKKLAENYDLDTQEKVTLLESQLQEANQIKAQKLSLTLSHNDAKVRSVLESQKDLFVQEIVDKVVEQYGR